MLPSTEGLRTYCACRTWLSRIRTTNDKPPPPERHCVNCENSEIEGFLKGKINIQQLLSLKSSAKVEGDIVTAKLSIEPGATFTGACSMGAKVKDMNSLEQPEPKESRLEEKSA